MFLFCFRAKQKHTPAPQPCRSIWDQFAGYRPIDVLSTPALNGARGGGSREWPGTFQGRETNFCSMISRIDLRFPKCTPKFSRPTFLRPSPHHPFSPNNLDFSFFPTPSHHLLHLRRAGRLMKLWLSEETMGVHQGVFFGQLAVKPAMKNSRHLPLCHQRASLTH